MRLINKQLLTIKIDVMEVNKSRYWCLTRKKGSEFPYCETLIDATTVHTARAALRKMGYEISGQIKLAKHVGHNPKYCKKTRWKKSGDMQRS
jgi:hypothetical protein